METVRLCNQIRCLLREYVRLEKARQYTEAGVVMDQINILRDRLGLGQNDPLPA